MFSDPQEGVEVDCTTHLDTETWTGSNTCIWSDKTELRLYFSDPSNLVIGTTSLTFKSGVQSLTGFVINQFTQQVGIFADAPSPHLVVSYPKNKRVGECGDLKMFGRHSYAITLQNTP